MKDNGFIIELSSYEVVEVIQREPIMNQVIKRDFIESASSLRSCDWATVHIGVS